MLSTLSWFQNTTLVSFKPQTKQLLEDHQINKFSKIPMKFSTKISICFGVKHADSTQQLRITPKINYRKFTEINVKT